MNFSDLISVGSICCGPKKYSVVYTHSHPTINDGDIVCIVESQGYDSTYYILRLRDMTLHHMQSGSQYVLVVPHTEVVS